MGFHGRYFGWEERLYRWEDFYQHRVRLVTSTQPLGMDKRADDSFMFDFPDQDLLRTACELRRDVADHVVACIRIFFARLGTDLVAYVSDPTRTTISYKTCS